MGTMQELQLTVSKQNEKIRHLESLLNDRDEEILQLKSQLDKFQSVFHYGVSSPLTRAAVPRKQRAQGISAEPLSLRTIQELSQQKFQTFYKSDGYERHVFFSVHCHLLRELLQHDHRLITPGRVVRWNVFETDRVLLQI